MPAEQGKELAVFLGLPFEDFGWAGGIVRIILCEFFAVLAIVSPPFTSQHYVYIQFGYYHFKAEALYEIDCCFQVFVWDFIEFEVALDSYCVDGNFAVFEVLQELLEFFLFVGKEQVVVVVDQHGLRVGGVSILKCFCNEVVAYDRQVGGGPDEVFIVCECFIQDVPVGDLAAVTGDDGFDVCLHPLKKKFTSWWIVSVPEEPRGGANVFGPDKTVPQDLLAVGGGEGDEGIGLVEIEYVPAPLDVVHFHAVGRSEDIELGADKIELFRRVIIGEPAIDGDGDIKTVFVCGTERWICLRVCGERYDNAYEHID